MMSDYEPNTAYIIIPTVGKIVWIVMATVAGLHFPRGWKRGQVMAKDTENKGPATMRNILIDNVRGRGAEWFILCDDDTVPPADGVIRLLEHGEKIAAGIVPLRAHGNPGLVIPEGEEAAKVDWKDGDLIYGDTGAAFMVVHRDVIDAFRGPWFEKPEGIDEGVVFCRKARELGFRTLVDCGVACGHVDRETEEVFYARQHGRAA